MHAVSLSRFQWSRTLALLLLTAFTGALFTVLAPAQSAHALCAEQPMVGNWHNIDSNTRSVTRVDVGFNCGDVVLCDENGCTGGESYFTVHAFGKCHPTDCDWGTRRTKPMGDGWERATYTYGWATVHLWVKTYSYYGQVYLRVYTWTDFTPADGRTDYASDQWMRK
jgi:hypothetical protein